MQYWKKAKKAKTNGIGQGKTVEWSDLEEWGEKIKFHALLCTNCSFQFTYKH